MAACKHDTITARACALSSAPQRNQRVQWEKAIAWHYRGKHQPLSAKTTVPQHGHLAACQHVSMTKCERACTTKQRGTSKTIAERQRRPLLVLFLQGSLVEKRSWPECQAAPACPVSPLVTICSALSSSCTPPIAVLSFSCALFFFSCPPLGVPSCCPVVFWRCPVTTCPSFLLLVC